MPPAPAKCVNGMAEILQPAVGNQCVVAYALPCFPNTCDAQGAACRVTQCQGDRDCAPGARCNPTNGLCAPIAYYCSSPTTITGSNGAQESCSPYQCVAGGCKPYCSNNGECASGYSCSGGHCVK